MGKHVIPGTRQRMVPSSSPWEVPDAVPASVSSFIRKGDCDAGGGGNDTHSRGLSGR